MFANLKFRDVFSFPALGIPPQLYATGSAAGTAIQVTAGVAGSKGGTGNYGNFKKWVFILQTGSGGATTQWNAWVNGGSGSGASCSTVLGAWTTLNTTLFSGSASYGSIFVVNSTNSAASYSYLGSNFGSAGTIVMEIRGEYINGLGSNFSWIRPVMSITGASAYAALLSLAFQGGSFPASNYDFNSYNGTGFCLQEVDAF